MIRFWRRTQTNGSVKAGNLVGTITAEHAVSAEIHAFVRVTPEHEQARMGFGIELVVNAESNCYLPLGWPRWL
jgi:hypothetical protein